ncbi:Beta-glucosidase 31 [Frankliniella fusca]|uniref:Beta-glucosidase 31 n=1 Tax=Frankliniella fusca TaxID=407009 RepID=A0AAE1LLV0_9NEOP|nr:Beta-glucosidase 31 [Frankliniella fusca]
MEDDFQSLSAWLSKNQLFMNYKKTTYMIFTKPSQRNNIDLELKINNEKILRVSSTKFLGLIIDETLCWKQHITSIMKKIGSIGGVVFRLRNILNKGALKSIYYGLVQSNLSYTSLIWGTATNSRLNPLQRLQNRTVKQIFGLHYRHPSLDLYTSLGIMPIRNLISQSASTFAYLITNKNKRNSQTKFKYNHEFHSHNTRNNSKLRPTVSNSTRYGLQAVRNNCIQNFNSLPEEFTTHRFSISWSRVLPTGGVDNINEKGVKYYKAYVDKVIENGMEPMVFPLNRRMCLGY